LHFQGDFTNNVIWNYIVSEISLEVQGGQDYFRFVEGTCIFALCLSSLSLTQFLSAAYLVSDHYFRSY